CDPKKDMSQVHSSPGSQTWLTATESGTSWMFSSIPAWANWLWISAIIRDVAVNPDWLTTVKESPSPFSMPSPHCPSPVPGSAHVLTPSGSTSQPLSSSSWTAASGSNWQAQPSVVPAEPGSCGTGPQVGAAVPFQTTSEMLS